MLHDPEHFFLEGIFICKNSGGSGPDNVDFLTKQTVNFKSMW